jgi:hypothetical protein
MQEVLSAPGNAAPSLQHVVPKEFAERLLATRGRVQTDHEAGDVRRAGAASRVQLGEGGADLHSSREV